MRITNSGQSFLRSVRCFSLNCSSVIDISIFLQILTNHITSRFRSKLEYFPFQKETTYNRDTIPNMVICITPLQSQQHTTAHSKNPEKYTFNTSELLQNEQLSEDTLSAIVIISSMQYYCVLTTILTTTETERIVHESTKRKTDVISPDKRALKAAERL